MIDLHMSVKRTVLLFLLKLFYSTNGSNLTFHLFSGELWDFFYYFVLLYFILFDFYFFFILLYLLFVHFASLSFLFILLHLFSFCLTFRFLLYSYTFQFWWSTFQIIILLKGEIRVLFSSKLDDTWHCPLFCDDNFYWLRGLEPLPTNITIWLPCLTVEIGVYLMVNHANFLL